MPYKDAEALKRHNKEAYLKNREARLAYAKAYRDSHKEQIRETQKRYRLKNKDKLDEYHAKYRKEHSEKNKAYQKEYKKKNPQKVRELNRQYRLSHKEELKSYKEERKALWGDAGYQVALAIRYGRLKKQPCEVCGDKASQAHHDDYSFPLQVRWLCQKCHSAWHEHNTPIYKKGV